MKNEDKESIDNAYIDWVYTPLDEAKRELERRRKDLGLIKRMKEFTDALPFPYLTQPKAVLSRPLATPNYELRAFLDQAAKIGLKPLILEYPSKLVMCNRDKYHACNLYFTEHPEKMPTVFPRKQKIKVVDIPKQEGKSMSAAETLFGLPLRELHHRLLAAELPDLTPESVVDFTEWFNAARAKTEYYYLQYLALFVCHGILFENFFLDDPSESKFVLEKIVPSFRRATELFGVKPLVVRLLPADHEKAKAWLSYPLPLAKKIEKDYGL